MNSTTIKCKKCGTIYPASDASCPSCGGTRRPYPLRQVARYLRPLFIIPLVLCILVAALLFVPVLVEKWQAAQPALEVTFETFGDHINENVTLVGEIALPGSQVLCGDECEFIYLENPDDYTQTINIFIATVPSLELLGSNQMHSLPFYYTCKDLKVRTYDGTLAGCGDLVAITGRSCESLYDHDHGWCIYKIIKIEKITDTPTSISARTPTS